MTTAFPLTPQEYEARVTSFRAAFPDIYPAILETPIETEVWSEAFEERGAPRSWRAGTSKLLVKRGPLVLEVWNRRAGGWYLALRRKNGEPLVIPNTYSKARKRVMEYANDALTERGSMPDPWRGHATARVMWGLRLHLDHTVQNYLGIERWPP